MLKEGRFQVFLLLVMNLIYLQHTDAKCQPDLKYLTDITIRDPKQLSDYWTSDESLILNDRYLTDYWYRVVFSGRQYIMADSNDNPKLTSCNTLYPIYLKDKHPHLDTLSENPVTKTACLLDFDDVCSEEIDVDIRKCDKEVQYHLKSTNHYSAYCFIAGMVIEAKDVPPPENVQLGDIQATPELHFKEENNGQNIHPIPKKVPFIQFRCVFSNSSNYFYSVQWKINDEIIATIGPSNNIDELGLHEDSFRHYSLGFDVSCSVSVSAAEFGQQTLPTYSKPYFAGVKLQKRIVTMNKNSHANISLSTTLPIGCRYFRPSSRNCKAEIRVINEVPVKCFEETLQNVINDNSGSDLCAQPIELLYNSEDWDRDKKYNFTIKTSDMTYEDKLTFRLKLQFNEIADNKFWSNRLLPDVKVIVKDSEIHKGRTCYAINDPHMQTADGHYYPFHEVGIFTLYHNKEYNIEVQITTKLCTAGTATCVCGVAIRAGKDVFISNLCGQSNIVVFTQCDDKGILDIDVEDTYNFHVYTPIGTKIRIKFLRGTLKGFLSIYIFMAPKDIYNVLGLCGKFDGNKTNDFVHRDKTTSPLTHHEKFADSWRVPEGEVFSSTNKFPLMSWSGQNGLYCFCPKQKTISSPVAMCSKTQYLNCERKSSITKTKCHYHNKRKRRSLAAHEKEMDRLFVLMKPVESHAVSKRQTHKNIISEEQAKQTCTKMINGSLAFTSYRNMTSTENPNTVITQCVFDIMATNDMSLADIHVDSVNTVVKGMMSEVPTYVETNEQEVKVFLKNSCSSNCSDRGNCSEDGECFCHQYYHGAICDIDERIPPIVTDIEGGGVCDIGEGDECRCFYLRGDNFLNRMKCKIVTSVISISGEITTVTTESVDGGFEDVFTGVCCIPDETTFSEDMFLREHAISISSDGEHYGENNTMYVFDSSCQKLDSMSSGKPSFALKNGFCFIKQACIEDTYTFLSNNDTCLSCNTAVSVNDWTETSMEICIPTTTTTATTTKPIKACNSTTATATVPETTTQSIVNVSSEKLFLKEIELKNESSINITSPAEQPETTSTESSRNITSSAEQSETTSTKPTTKKACKIKDLRRFKKRKNRLSLRNKKRKMKIQRLTQQLNRLKSFLKRLRNKSKNGKQTSTNTKTIMKSTTKVSNLTAIKTVDEQSSKIYANKSTSNQSNDNKSVEITTEITTPSVKAFNEQIPTNYVNKTASSYSNDNKGDEITTVETTPILSTGTSGMTINDQQPDTHEDIHHNRSNGNVSNENTTMKLP